MTEQLAPSPWLTRDEVAARLRLPKQTLALWASKGYGPPYSKFGRHCRYHMEDLIVWERDQVAGGAA